MFSSISSILNLPQLFGEPSPAGPFTPTHSDVRLVRSLLKLLRLPTELILQILDHAEYWPTHTFTAQTTVTAAASHAGVSDARLYMVANVFENRTADAIRESREPVRIRRMVFEMSSRDQGWTSEQTEGTFKTSSWTEVALARPTSREQEVEGLPMPDEEEWFDNVSEYRQWIMDRGWELVKNRMPTEPHSGDEFAWWLQGNCVAAGLSEYRVVWDAEGFVEGNEGAGKGSGLLDALQDGDKLLVWVRAMYPGWQCVVQSADVTVFYGS